MTDGQVGGTEPGAAASLDGEATTALVLGILALVICPICGPFALVKGKNVNKRLQAMGASANGKATAGFILGIIGTVWLGLAALWVLFLIVIGIGAAAAAAGAAR